MVSHIHLFFIFKMYKLSEYPADSCLLSQTENRLSDMSAALFGFRISTTQWH